MLTLASIGLPTTSGFTGEFLALLGAFSAAWPLHTAGPLPLCSPSSAVAGVVLGALYMLASRSVPVRRGEGAAPAVLRPQLPGRPILSAIVVAIFALGLFPDGPMKKTELAAIHTGNWSAACGPAQSPRALPIARRRARCASAANAAASTESAR